MSSITQGKSLQYHNRSFMTYYNSPHKRIRSITLGSSWRNKATSNKFERKTQEQSGKEMQIPGDHSLPLWHQDTKKGEPVGTRSLVLVVIVLVIISIFFPRILRSTSTRSRMRARLTRLTSPIWSQGGGVIPKPVGVLSGSHES